MAFISEAALEARRRAFDKSLDRMVGGFKTIADDARRKEALAAQEAREKRQTAFNVLNTADKTGLTPRQVGEQVGIDVESVFSPLQRETLDVAPTAALGEEPIPADLGTPEGLPPEPEPRKLGFLDVQTPGFRQRKEIAELQGQRFQQQQFREEARRKKDARQERKEQRAAIRQDTKDARDAVAKFGLTPEQALSAHPNARVTRDELNKISEESKKKRAKTVKPTDAQSKAAGFAVRIEEANAIFDESDQLQFTDIKTVAARKMPEITKSEALKNQEQAERNFINALLRRESGAVISDQEFDNAAKQYFPLPGDTNATLRQKKRNRDLVLSSLKNAAGDDVYNDTKLRFLEGTLTDPEDLEALQWVRDNIDDPKASEILKELSKPKAE